MSELGIGALAVETRVRSHRLPGCGHGFAEYSPIDANCFVEIMQSFLDRFTGFDDTCFKYLRVPRSRRFDAVDPEFGILR